MVKITIKPYDPKTQPAIKKTVSTGKQSPLVQQPGFIPKRRDSFIGRCIRIIKDDIDYKLHGVKTPDRQKWEDYERFLKMARGGK